MSRPGRAALAALLTAAALAVVLWRWVNVGVHPAAIALALFVLAGVPAVVWLAPLVPSRPSPHRLPLTFWIGVAMLAVAAGGILLGAARMGTALGGGSSSTPMPPARQAKAPAAAVQAVDAVLPRSHIPVAYVADGGFWLLFIARGNQLVADASWQAGSDALTLDHLGWNTALGAPQVAGPVYSWSHLRHQVVIPKGVPVFGPYRLPGYDAMVVPEIGQVWFLQVNGHGVEGGAL